MTHFVASIFDRRKPSRTTSTGSLPSEPVDTECGLGGIPPHLYPANGRKRNASITSLVSENDTEMSFTSAFSGGESIPHDLTIHWKDVTQGVILPQALIPCSSTASSGFSYLPESMDGSPGKRFPNSAASSRSCTVRSSSYQRGPSLTQFPPPQLFHPSLMPMSPSSLPPSESPERSPPTPSPSSPAVLQNYHLSPFRPQPLRNLRPTKPGTFGPYPDAQYVLAALIIQRRVRFWIRWTLRTRKRYARQRNHWISQLEKKQLRNWSALRIQAWFRGRRAIAHLSEQLDAVWL